MFERSISGENKSKECSKITVVLLCRNMQLSEREGVRPERGHVTKPAVILPQHLTYYIMIPIFMCTI